MCKTSLKSLGCKRKKYIDIYIFYRCFGVYYLWVVLTATLRARQNTNNEWNTQQCHTSKGQISYLLSNCFIFKSSWGGYIGFFDRARFGREHSKSFLVARYEAKLKKIKGKGKLSWTLSLITKIILIIFTTANDSPNLARCLLMALSGLEKRKHEKF